MKKHHFLSPLLLVIISACGGGGDGSAPPPVDAVITIDSRALVADQPLMLCLDADNDYLCDQPAVGPEQLKLKASDAKQTILVELSADPAIGVGIYGSKNGNPIMAFPLADGSIDVRRALAVGVLEMLNGEDRNRSEALVQVIKTLGTQVVTQAQAEAVLAQYLSIDGSAEQEKALLQAVAFNQSQLAQLGLDKKYAYLEAVRFMAESLFSAIAEASRTCDAKKCSLGSDQAPLKSLDLSYLRACEDGTPAQPCAMSPLFDDLSNVKPFRVESLFVDAQQGRDIRLAQNRELGIVLADQVAIDELECDDGEIKQVYSYGIADDFDASIPEPTQVAANVIDPGVLVWVHNSFDFPTQANNHDWFAQTLSGIPSDIQKARLVIALREEGIHIPFFDIGTIFGDVISFTGAVPSSANLVPINQLRSNWSQVVNSDVYHQDASSIAADNNQTLLQLIRNGVAPTVNLGISTSVDYIAVATCRVETVETNYDEVIQTLKSDFSCDEDTGLEVSAGVFDGFSFGEDELSYGAISVPGVNHIEYDQSNFEAGVLLDSFVLPSNYSFSRAILITHTRPSQTNSSSNNALLFGSYADQEFAVDGFSGSASSVSEIWTGSSSIRLMDGSAPIYRANGTQVGNLLDYLNSGATTVDLLIHNTVEVDGAELLLCGSGQCRDRDGDGYCDDDEVAAGSDPLNSDSIPSDIDGDGTANDEDCAPEDPNFTDNCDAVVISTLPASCQDEVTVDLSDPLAWKNSIGMAPVVLNEFANTVWAGRVWDYSVDWFNFGSASNTEHELGIDFCSCGQGGLVDVTQMKSDNYGKVFLDTDANPGSFGPGNGYIVQRQINTQDSMTDWGSNVSGSTAIAFTGSANDHRLNFVVKNLGGPSGGGVNGTLKFTGHLGACTAADVFSNESGDDNVGGDTGVVLDHDNGQVASVARNLLDALDKDFSCAIGEQIASVTLGVADQFSAAVDTATPSATLIGLPASLGYANTALRAYDDFGDNRYFADSFAGLPANIVRAQLSVGLERRSNNDTIMIGHAAEFWDPNVVNSSKPGQTFNIAQLSAGGWQTALVAANSMVATVNLNTMPGRNGLPLLDSLNSHASLDVMVQDDTAVDFARLMYCTVKKVGEPGSTGGDTPDTLITAGVEP